ncbi:MAG: Fe-only/vanadium nitrogenase subunit delta [Rhodospirillales bacterium]
MPKWPVNAAVFSREPEISEVLGGLRDRLVDLAITRSRNHELTHTLY